MDIGSNSVLLLVARAEGGRIVEILADGSEITRLGEGVDQTECLGRAPIARTLAAASRFGHQARELGVEKLWIITTSAVREASNREQFLERVRGEVGGDVEVLSGQEEAERAFLGVQSNECFQSSPLLVMDVGGGSTELILGAEGQIEQSASLPIGCVRLAERLLGENPVSDEALNRALDFAREFLSSHLRDREVRDRLLVGTGGTATTLAAVDQKLTTYAREKVDGYVLSGERVGELLERLRQMDLEARTKVPGLAPKRADVIVAGIVIFRAALETWGREQLAVSDRGVRYGTILKRLAERR